MSRFIMYGGNDCETCDYHRRSKAYKEVMRCCFPANLRSNYLGTVYMNTPEKINWRNKCENYKGNKLANN